MVGVVRSSRADEVWNGSRKCLRCEVMLVMLVVSRVRKSNLFPVHSKGDQLI